MVEIKINIPNGKLEDFRKGFLKAYPKENKNTTDLDHVKNFLKKQLINYYKTGKIMIARETTKPDIDEGVVSES